MAEKKPAMKSTRTSTRSTSAAGRSSSGFSAEEKAAARERVRELKAGESADSETEVLHKIAEMPERDRAMAERLHALIKTSVPELSPKTWYGMPAYAKGGNLICHFQPAQKFKTRYATLGFSDKAKLDDGAVWPVAYALKELTPADEARIVALVKQAAS